MVGNFDAIVIVAIGAIRPAVVRAPVDAVELIAARRAVLDFPQLPVEVGSEAEHVAVAVGPDLLAGAIPGGERIVRRDAAVWIEPHNRAEVVGHVLRRRLLHAVPAGDEQVGTVGRKGDAVREMSAAGDGRLLLPDHFQPFDGTAICARTVQRTACDHGAAGITLGSLGPGEVDRPAAGVIGREGDVAKAALSAIGNFRQAGDVDNTPARRREQLRRAGLLGDEDIAGARLKGHRPGFVEAGKRAGGKWRACR